MTLDDVADELYGLDPGEFVEARTKHVKAARDDNDRTLGRRDRKTSEADHRGGGWSISSRAMHQRIWMHFSRLANRYATLNAISRARTCDG